MASVQLRATSALLRLTKKSRIALPFIWWASLKARHRVSNPPAWLSIGRDINERRLNGFTVYSIVPAGKTPARAVMYLHGGKYVRRITHHHWRFIRKLVDLGFRVDVPLYGLAPRKSYREAIPFLLQALDELMNNPSVESTSIVGDSAGGALAVVLSQHRRAGGQSAPAQLVLISPWMDVTMSNPDIAAAEKRDPWLKSSTLVKNGESWASGDNPRHPDISPIYGGLEGLPPIDIYIGTHDALYPDALRFAEMAEQAGSPVELHVENGAFHNYVLGPIPEGKKAAQEIFDRLNRS